MPRSDSGSQRSMRERMEVLIDEMIDGKILLREALDEFEKVFIQRALDRNDLHISNTSETLGIHRNTVAKKLASYNGASGASKNLSRKRRTS